MNILPLACQWGRENWKAKELWVVLSFSFLPCHRFKHKSLIIQGSNMNKKTYNRVPRHLCFLECHCLLSVFSASSGLNRECSLLGLSASPLSHKNNMVTLYSLWVSLNSHAWGLVHSNSAHHKRYMWIEQPGTEDARITHTSSTHTHSIVPLGFSYKAQVQR